VRRNATPEVEGDLNLRDLTNEIISAGGTDFVAFFDNITKRKSDGTYPSSIKDEDGATITVKIINGMGKALNITLSGKKSEKLEIIRNYLVENASKVAPPSREPTPEAPTSPVRRVVEEDDSSSSSDDDEGEEDNKDSLNPKTEYSLVTFGKNTFVQGSDGVIYAKKFKGKYNKINPKQRADLSKDGKTVASKSDVEEFVKMVMNGSVQVIEKSKTPSLPSPSPEKKKKGGKKTLSKEMIANIQADARAMLLEDD